METKDMVNNPEHYNQGRYEVIDIIEDAALGYHLSAALKYILRCKYKDKEVEDLQKAVWYINRYISMQTNVGKDLGYNAWSCRGCQKGTNLVDSTQLCSDCRNLQDSVDSKATVSPSKASEHTSKVIHHIMSEKPLGARTERPRNANDHIYYCDCDQCLVLRNGMPELFEDEKDIERQKIIAEHGKSETAEMIRREEYRRENRRVFGTHNIPKNNEQLTLWELAQYD